MAKPFSKFLKILKKLFEKSFLSGVWGGAPSRLGKSNLIFGSITPKNWGGFSAKKTSV